MLCVVKAVVVLNKIDREVRAELCVVWCDVVCDMVWWCLRYVMGWVICS
jgi:hypothetical protein